MSTGSQYPIGRDGVPWGEADKQQWFARQSVKRLYREEVLPAVERAEDKLRVETYGALSLDPGRYPLYSVRSMDWKRGKPGVLITGGVHGYETSGVQGALRFLSSHIHDYDDEFNFLVLPCISPWGYETINRWNPHAVDPNRDFRPNGESEEAQLVLKFLDGVGLEFAVHIDLHETTDTDNSEFRPALAARDGKPQDIWNIPDGFYLVGDSARPKRAFQRSIIESVEKVTHIAPPDRDGRIIGVKLEQHGVIHYDARPLGLCMGVTGAEYVTTTEVYPDSPKASDEICIQAQVAAVTGALDFLRLAS